MDNMDNINSMNKMDNLEGEACMITRTPLPAVTVVGMAYVPFQQFGTIYDPEKALRSGTLFPDLDKPFLGGRGVLK